MPQKLLDATEEEWHLARELYRAAHYDEATNLVYAYWNTHNNEWKNYFLTMARKLRETYRVIAKDSVGI